MSEHRSAPVLHLAGRQATSYRLKKVDHRPKKATGVGVGDAADVVGGEDEAVLGVVEGDAQGVVDLAGGDLVEAGEAR